MHLGRQLTVTGGSTVTGGRVAPAGPCVSIVFHDVQIVIPVSQVLKLRLHKVS